jgi:hypothetical protein
MGIYLNVDVEFQNWSNKTAFNNNNNNNNNNSMALVRKRPIATERPPLVGEVSATFSG